MAALAITIVACSFRDGGAVASLSDDEFGHLTTTLSEPAGAFDHADNLVSNEALFAAIAQRLRARGGVYIGVGPEQNFSYISRLRPSLAFIVDIRRDNRNLHLMYKALFETSADRASFLSRLFSRPHPPSVGPFASASDLFAAFDRVGPSLQMLKETKQQVRDHLLHSRGLPLTVEDLLSIDSALDAFHADGPSIRYGRSLPPAKSRPSYRTLMTTADLRGNPRSFLGTEEAFRFIQARQIANLIVPVVGDFAGGPVIGRIAQYTRQRGLTVSAFYASNVEVYLSRDQRRTFCASLQMLPHDEGTYFIGSRQLQPLTGKLASCAQIRPSLHWP
jgi:hypothetical protein